MLATLPPSAGQERPAAGVVSGRRLLRLASARLRQSVAFDAAAWFTTDPDTIVPTHPTLADRLEVGDLSVLWEHEQRTPDVLQFRDLGPATSLLKATNGNPLRSRRYREFLAPRGFQDELRAALRSRGRTWGVLTMLRRTGAFTTAETTQVARAAASVAPRLADLMTLAGTTGGSTYPSTPGSALYTLDSTPIASDAWAERWLAELPSPETTVAALISRAHAVELGHDGQPASARVLTPAGQWLTLHASVLARPRQVALIIGPSSLPDVSRIRMLAYGLTPRESEVAGAAGLGLSNLDIAAHLHLSPHTVRCHLKAAFAKTGTTSRTGLAARLQSQS